MRNIRQVLIENEQRLAKLDVTYNPHTGEGSYLDREELYYQTSDGREAHLWLPSSMMEVPAIELLSKTKSIKQTLKKTIIGNNVSEAYMKLFESEIVDIRFNHDFEFWAIMAVKITNKPPDGLEVAPEPIIPFRLNFPQRGILLPALEEQRLAKKPIRACVVKARQWGGSTETQLYIAWLQARLFKGFNSVIVADKEPKSANIRGMYSLMREHYPKELGKIIWTNFESQQKIKYWKERETKILVASAEKPEGVRAFDIRAAHLSEISSWEDTPKKSARALMQSLEGTLPSIAESLCVLESTANGTGDYFHTACLKAERGESNYKHVFVPWFVIENYSKEFTERENRYSFVKNKMKDEEHYYWELWDLGATLEAIHWYHYKRRDYVDDWGMKSEFPSTAREAFQSTGRRVFPQAYTEKSRKHNLNPIAIGELFADDNKGADALKNINFEKVNQGGLHIWEFPDKETKVSERYVVSLDVGGASKKADPSVISVIDRFGLIEDDYVEVVAEWRGIIDQDLMAWKAIQVAKWYNEALFVPEINMTIDASENVEGDSSFTIIDEIVRDYDNVYCRTEPDKIMAGIPAKYGFHTNRQTKPMIIMNMRALIRDTQYIERSVAACSEMETYEHQDGNKMNAITGTHDDIIMSRAIGLWVATKYLEPPKLIVPKKHKSYSTRIVGEATI